MTRFSSLVLGSIVAVACGQPLGIPAATPTIDVTKDKDGQTLYSGRPLAAWIGDLKDKDLLRREEAIEVLAGIGRPAESATAELRKLLKADNRNLRIRAALAVWKVGGDSKGVPEIFAEGLKGASTIVRREAILALGSIGPDAAAATTALVDCLDDPDYTLRNQVANTIRQFGKAATPALLGCLKSKSAITRQNALIHLGVTSLGKEHVPAVSALLRDDTPRCRVEAARLLWKMGETGPPVVAALLEGVKAPNGEFQPIILQTLSNSTERPKTLLPVLRVCIDGFNDYYRVQAARILFEVEKKPDRVLPLYLEILRDPSVENRGYAGFAMSAIADMKADALPALPRLIELVKTSSRNAPYDLRKVLAGIGTPAVAPLVEILESSSLPADSHGYETAIAALGDLGAPAAKAVLPLLSSRDEAVRVRAIRVFSGLGAHAKDAVPKLIEAIPNRSLAVRHAAVQALGRLGEVALPAVPRLVETAGDRDANLRLLSLQALASISPDTEEFVPLCLPLLRDPNASIRQAALQLLLAAADHKAILPAALKLLDDPLTRGVGLTLIGAMGTGGAKAVPRLAKLLAESDARSKQVIVVALGQIGPPAKAVAPALLDLLTSTDSNLVNCVAQSLRNIEPDAKASLPKLLASLRKSENLVAGPIFTLMGRYGKSAEEAFPPLLAILEDTTRRPQVRASAAVALSRISPARAKKEALPAMRILLATAEEKFVVASAVFLADPADKSAIAFFESDLRSTAFGARSNACSTLGRLGPAAKRFLPLIREMRESKSYLDRAVAAQAAYLITGDAGEALPTLEAMLDDKAQPWSQGNAAYYLGEMGVHAKHLLPKLRAIRAGSDANARARAALAVRKIEKAIEAARRKSPDPDANP